MSDRLATIQYLAKLSSLYKGRFLEPLWNKYPSRESNDWDALMIFLEGYAFARQGAPSDFSHAACDVIQQLKDDGLNVTESNVPSKAWRAFSSLLKNSDLNHSNNPLCPQGTEYVRRFKGAVRTARTSKLSVLEFLQSLVSKGEPANIIIYAKRNLQSENLGTTHRRLSRSISGVASKIASFFLRDVAAFYRISPSRNRHVLQPIDVWIRRISWELMGNYEPDEKIATWIVQEAIRINIDPEAINQGMWYFGSQIAGSEYRVTCALNDVEYAEALGNEHIESLRSGLKAWQ